MNGYLGDGKMKGINNIWLIHLFALVHALVAFGCRLMGIADDLMLTLLTMLMVVLVCLNKQMSGRFMSLCVIAANIAGLALGTVVAWLLGRLSQNPLVVFPASTLVCTEILGWSVDGLASWTLRSNPPSAQSRGLGSSRSRRWLIGAFVVVIVIRMAVILFTADFSESRNLVIGIVLDYLFSCVALVWLADYAIRVGERAEQEKEKANLAQYRYMKLKQQVNPHFLFNSLNVLDCMIHEQSAEEASIYTHKLAEIYRYMLRNEEETLVSLRDELTFTGLFTDLLKVRFQDGLDIKVDIPEELMSRRVVPCCVQLLVENATKHNAVRAGNPLHITVSAGELDGDACVTVSNNICPKLSKPASTGLGLKYIQKQYSDLSGKGISILAGESSYCVSIPLL